MDFNNNPTANPTALVRSWLERISSCPRLSAMAPRSLANMFPASPVPMVLTHCSRPIPCKPGIRGQATPPTSIAPKAVNTRRLR